jgi:hypothetical protein
MFYLVNNHLNNLYVLSNKAVGPGKNPKLISVGPTSIQEARVTLLVRGDRMISNYTIPFLNFLQKSEELRKN